MALRLLVLSSAGLPLLSCSSSPALPPLPFATTGLTSALLSSCSSHDYPLTSLLTSDARTTVLSFSSVVLVLTSHQTQRGVDGSLSLLHQLEDALVLLTGRAALEETKAVERLKRKLRSCTPLLLSLLTATSSSTSPTSIPVQVGLPEYAERPPSSSPLSPLLDDLLTSLSTACSTQHVALYVGHRLLLPSSLFGLLHPSDLLALSCLLLVPPPPPTPRQQPPSSADLVDRPIFLSHSLVHGQRVDGCTAYRLLQRRLSPALSAVLLCGPTPSREEAQLAIQRVWAKQQRGLADWDGSAEPAHWVEEDEDAAEQPRVSHWLLLVSGKKVVTAGMRQRSGRQRSRERGTRSNSASQSVTSTRTAQEGAEVDEEAGRGHRPDVNGAVDEVIDDGACEGGSDAGEGVEQLLSFYHSSTELLHEASGEAYMQLGNADLWAVRSGELALYARVVGCCSVQQSRSLTLSQLQMHLDRRKQRSSVIDLTAPLRTPPQASAG